MSGVFTELVELVNRAPIDLSVTFDGQSKPLPAVSSTMVPKTVVQFAKNQNPIMGTQDPYNPHISGCQYLVGVKGTKDPVDPLTVDEWAAHLGQPCREDVQQLFEDRYANDPKAKLVVRNQGRKSTGRSRADAGASPTGNADFSGKQ